MLKTVFKLTSFLPVITSQNLYFGRKVLERTPEPTSEMENEESVRQYVRGARETQLFLAYAMALRQIHRFGHDYAEKAALDIACGTGQFTLDLADFFPFAQVTGLDISKPMVERAQANAEQRKSGVEFKFGNAMDLSAYRENQFSLTTFNQAAHHFEKLADVRSVFMELDRVTKPDGLILSTDLVRLNSCATTQRYVKLVTSDYPQRGLAAFAEDFQNSMFAAWTLDELAQAIPTSGKRKWFQMSPRLLPTTQIVVGLPSNYESIRKRTGNPWPKTLNYIPEHLRSEWSLLKKTIATGRIRPI